MSSEFNRAWIYKQGIPIVRSRMGDMTLRGLHYKLVNLGMTNDIPHYKKIVASMIKARWDGLLPYGAFLDHERDTLGTTHFERTDVESSAESAKAQIKIWATSYYKNRWENQIVYPEVFIEKKTMQGLFERPCRRWGVALNPCKGYPSITYQHDAARRFHEAQDQGKEPVILYFGDYDCSGEDIPRSIGESLWKMGIEVEIRRVALMEHQVLEWNLPPAPTKTKDSRSHNWDGIGQVEMDAAEDKLIPLLDAALDDLCDPDLFDELGEQENVEKEEFRNILKRDFDSLLEEE